MKNRLITFITLTVLFMGVITASARIGGAYKAAYFKDGSATGTNISVPAGGPTGYVRDNYSTWRSQTTAEVWVKLDTTLSTYNYNTPAMIFQYQSTTAVNVMKMYVLHDSVFAEYGPNRVKVGYTYPTITGGIIDSNWHHIALTSDTVTVPYWPFSLHDSISLFLDGVIVSTNLTPHNTSYGTSFDKVNIGFFTTTSPYYWQGHMAKVVLYDSVMYSSTFTPDCVYDTVMFYNAVTQNITHPVVLLLPLNGNDTVYEWDNVPPAHNHPKLKFPSVVYNYMTSPCAPLYTYYAPSVITDSAVIWAHNNNASYMKGAHAPTHVNGWTGIVTSVTEGIFTDSLHVYASGIYPYFSDYYNDTIAHKPITVNSTINGVAMVERPGLTIYPNPSSGALTIKTDEPGTVIIADISGRVIKQVYVNGSATLSDLKSGIYIVSANSHHFRLIVQ